MSSYKGKALRALYKEFNLDSGYVLNLTKSQFEECFDIVDIDIWDEKYSTKGTSKGKLLKEFIRLEEDDIVTLVLMEIRAYKVKPSITQSTLGF